ncbi:MULTISPECIES: 50S ribosomal protein L23 [Desulfovibrio]|jgi:large subunit ribosomal protein L23|uniref:Large ribosomal subunit protein uL23 n=2 Tax=root TaxID=1 RepID=A0A212J8M2_9BACT|nr:MULTISPECIES: 50S ribosomal protein L23 [Desulfovibrio]MBD8896954.1 50S ribosomal protein L23 [Desulfovibrio desulfuricans]MBT9748253.1 50S ribosomal protein L23 [Desulfovibrio desulfuricans]MCB6542604.1 50S ribosomal protein L23 [Desulfovibrio desulfuricans]MCB6553592.1 50S ribosomal protein L23 [Desulfovibrio desulfuricans]MCB6565674.1 50S ribosomal protein L23 [Desulfovibrio desulfuricans]
METTSVLLKPLLTEKTTLIKDEAQQVAFMVHTLANKLEIKQAVEKAFDVKVEAVNVVRRAPMNRERQGRVVGRKPGWKKAYVTLRQGDKIEFFEGV